MRPDFFEGLDVLGGQLGRFPVEQRQEDVVGVDVGVAGHGLRDRRRMMPPLGLGVDLQLVLLGVVPEVHIHPFGLKGFDERIAREAQLS